MRASLCLRNIFAFFLAICLCLSLTACSRMENVETGASSNKTTTEPVTEDPATGVLSSGETIEYYTPSLLKNPGNREVTLFIWNVDTYKTVQWKYRDTLTVRKLLEGLAHETNWDLSVADVKLDDQNVTILWSEDSSLYQGVPKRQNKEYLVFNQKDLDAAILDSVKTTIVENLGPSYSVFYANARGEDLVLPEVDITIPANDAFYSFWDY